MAARIPFSRAMDPLSPTPEQFDALVNFLLSGPDDEPRSCPFPIHGASDNIPRWEPSEAFTYFDIFRDRYERRRKEARESLQFHEDTEDWPEIGAEMFLALQLHAEMTGRPVDQERVEKAKKTLELGTPTSRCWTGPRPRRRPW